MKFYETVTLTLFLIKLTSCLSFDKYRLPKNIRPTNYNLYLNINPEKSFFAGKVKITLEVLNGTTNVVFLHTDHNYIKIGNIHLNGTNCNFSLYNDVETQIFPVKCEKEYRSGDELTISYTGRYSLEMNGLYKSTYDDQILVATMFEPVYTRRAFPCFDEPSFKAYFEIIVEHPNRYKALANTPFEFINTTRNSTTTIFQKTPKMSTYLVAIVVSQFEPAINRDQQFNVFARRSATENMGIAKKYGRHLFDCMSQWTGIRYDDMGNSQQYLIAIPDFAAGALENWGLINFRELDLLDDGNGTSRSSFQTILMVMSHEIAHQWFGNYVTLDWWSNVWLNEGLAEYFSNIVMNMIDYGNLEMDKQFIVDTLQKVLEKDAVFSSVPLSLPENSVKTNFEISIRFDEITYLKGASIIRMMKYILGEDAFKKGIQNYLTKNKYKNTTPEIFLKALEDAAGDKVVNFEQKMLKWIYQSGFPLVIVTIKNETTVTISQEQFCISQNCSKSQWYIPLSYTTGKLKNFSVEIINWLEPNKLLDIKHDINDWLIVNLQESGFYRVNYDNTLWEKIIKTLNSPTGKESVHPLNRAQIVDDIFQIAKIGKVKYEKVFRLVQYLERETSYYPWISAIRSFNYLIGNVEPETQKLLKKWLLKIIDKAFSGNKKYVTHIDILKDSEISSFSCKLGHKECLLYAKNQFRDFKKKNVPLDANKKYLIMCYGLLQSKMLKEDYEFLLDVFKKSPSAHEKYLILTALGCMQDEQLLINYLNLTLTQLTPIRQQDFGLVVNSVYYNNKKGVGVVLDFMNKNLKNMEIAYGEARLLSSLLADIADKVSSIREINKMKNILENYKHEDTVKLVGTPIIEIITSNTQWQEEYGNEIKLILKKLSNSGQRHNVNFIVIFCVIVLLGFKQQLL